MNPHGAYLWADIIEHTAGAGPQQLCAALERINPRLRSRHQQCIAGRGAAEGGTHSGLERRLRVLPAQEGLLVPFLRRCDGWD